MEAYKKSANGGNCMAMMEIGDLYANGSGVPADNAQAQSWHAKAQSCVSGNMRTPSSASRTISRPRGGRTRSHAFRHSHHAQIAANLGRKCFPHQPARRRPEGLLLFLCAKRTWLWSWERSLRLIVALDVIAPRYSREVRPAPTPAARSTPYTPIPSSPSSTSSSSNQPFTYALRQRKHCHPHGKYLRPQRSIQRKQVGALIPPQ